MQIFITGGTGFIGSALIKYLLSQSDELIIHALYRKSSRHKLKQFKDHQRLKFFEGELNDRESLRKAMDGCVGAYHLAAFASDDCSRKYLFRRINVEGTDSVLSVAHELKMDKVVFTSTGGTLANSQNGELVDESMPLNRSFFSEYERSKFEAECLVKDYVLRGLNVTIVNPTRVYGPGPINRSNAVTELIRRYLKRQWRIILGNGEAYGNYTFIRDVARGHHLAMKKGRSGERYILGGENLTYNRLFDLVGIACGRKQKMIHVPVRFARLFSKIDASISGITGKRPIISPEWVDKYALDWKWTSKKAEQELGYNITPAEDALHQTVQWLRTLDQQ